MVEQWLANVVKWHEYICSLESKLTECCWLRKIGRLFWCCHLEQYRHRHETKTIQDSKSKAHSHSKRATVFTVWSPVVPLASLPTVFFYFLVPPRLSTCYSVHLHFLLQSMFLFNCRGGGERLRECSRCPFSNSWNCLEHTKHVLS